MRRGPARAIAVAASLLVTSSAGAVPPPPQSPPRALPDYDGRGDDGATAGDALLWVPRVLLSPLYFVSEFLVRRPLGWLITTAERNHWPTAIANFFVFGPDKKAGVVPAAFVDFGVRASVGFYAFWDDAFVENHDLRLHASTFGVDWLSVAYADRVRLDKNTRLDMRFEYVHRPDQLFHGLGPDSLQGDRMRYGIDRVAFGPDFETYYFRGSRLSLSAGYRGMRFRDDACCEDPSLAVRASEGRATLPPGYTSGYSAFVERAEVTLDTREKRPAPQSGVRFEAEVEQGADLASSRNAWLRYGGTFGGYVDLTSTQRTLSLSLTLLFADPLGGASAEVPFTEQVVLGGSGPMRGYLYGRLIGRSAAISTLKYRWPIWAGLDGAAQLATGNVFNQGLEGFTAKGLRLSGAIGIETIGSPDNTFEILVGAGTETFDHGANVNSIRFLFGTNRGF